MTPTIPPDIPLSFTTSRLLLRCPQPGDGAAFFAAAQESRAALEPWFDLTNMSSVAQCEANLLGSRSDFLSRISFEFLLFPIDQPTLAGRVAINHVEWNTPSCEVGYWIRTSFGGQGLMTEAVVGLTRFAIRVLGMNRVAIFCNERNTRSAEVARRAGYLFEGIVHNSRRHFRSQELVNACMFAFLPEMLDRETLSS